MEKNDYREMMDALRDLNNALRSLLHLNWQKYTWAKSYYYKLSPIYDRIRESIYQEEVEEKRQALKKNGIEPDIIDN